jgi:eukaryotic-like serine/threonine-protein kinase
MKPGEMFGRYCVERVLGSGAMGTVLAAWDEKLQRRVAIKVMQEPSDADTRARFLREARAAAALEHPNVVGIYDVGEADGLPFIAMQLVEGRSLRDAATEDVPVARRIAWLVAIAKGLHAAHRAGLVHRDVKPENVLIDENDQPRIVDFGIARSSRAFDAEDETAKAALGTVTGAGVVLGTPRYMAPEQLRNEDLDARVDQFAWGVTAYEVLAGKVPWEATDMLSLVTHVLTSPMPDFPESSGVSRAIGDVVRRALSKDREQRFASMEAVAEALNAASKEPARSVVSPRGQSVEMPATVVARPRRKTARIAVIAGVVVPLAIASFVFVRREVSPREAIADAGVDAAKATTGIGVLDLPRTPIRSREAETAYVAGLRAERDWDPAAATRAMAEAVRLEPDLAAAHFRLGIFNIVVDAERARTSFAEASRLRDRLTARDAAVLDALRPWFLQPSNPVLSAEKLQALHAQYPGDAELLMLEGAARFLAGSPAAAIAPFEASLRADDRFAYASMQLVAALRLIDREAEAEKTARECVARSPTATQCWMALVAIDDHRGDRVACRNDLDVALSALPTSGIIRTFRAGALAPDAPRAAFESELALTLAATEPAERATVLARAAASLDIMEGKLGEAAASLTRGAASARPKSFEGRYFTYENVFLLLEEIDDREALGRFADDTEVSLQAGLPQTLSFGALAARTEPYMWRASIVSGRKSAADVERARDTAERLWLERAPDHRALIWLRTRATLAYSEAEAKRALEKLPPEGPATDTTAFALDWHIGRTYVLAGRPRDALRWLEPSAGSCRTIAMPVTYVRALHWLGRAREETNDRAGACQAYAEVLKHWGNAKPKSITAEATRTRVRALGCAS